MFSTCHQSLVDNLRSIVSPGINMDALLHHRVRPRAEGLPRLVPTCLHRRLVLLALLGIRITHSGHARCIDVGERGRRSA